MSEPEMPILLVPFTAEELAVINAAAFNEGLSTEAWAARELLRVSRFKESRLSKGPPCATDTVVFGNKMN